MRGDIRHPHDPERDPDKQPPIQDLDSGHVILRQRTPVVVEQQGGAESGGGLSRVELRLKVGRAPLRIAGSAHR